MDWSCLYFVGSPSQQPYLKLRTPPVLLGAEKGSDYFSDQRYPRSAVFQQNCTPSITSQYAEQ